MLRGYAREFCRILMIFYLGLFRRICGIWIIERQFRLQHKYLRFKEESNYNVVVGDATFIYMQCDDDRMLFVKIWDDPGRTNDPEDWETMWENPRTFCNLLLMEARNMITGYETWDLLEHSPDTIYNAW